MHRSHRLKKNEQFQEVFQKGTSAANKQFVVYAVRQEGQAVFRAGISVGKKIGKAVTRNRVKRLIREAIASMEEEIQTGLDLVIIARPGLEEMSYEELRGALQHVLKRAKVLKQAAVPREKRG
ncbi:ribonuclease P protein component [Brevibacillus sp. SYP-B805]|uniref:ribonuclease P protein component n=1 Tax=Brevibacillus sp. SYP-B805 TaxID=1578199 RepID=UPI0013EAD19F|nr:ribonuclease P protein component [Brevibacillus sp. SYP-B805]NGQ96554.1 ribonuclease P protein component [Brevibacillus sp. SYP-B805]